MPKLPKWLSLFVLVVVFGLALTVTTRADGPLELPRDGDTPFYAAMCAKPEGLFVGLFAPEGFAKAVIYGGASADQLVKINTVVLSAYGTYLDLVDLHGLPMPAVGKVKFKNPTTKESVVVKVPGIEDCDARPAVVVKRPIISDMPLTPGASHQVKVVLRNTTDHKVKGVKMMFGAFRWPDNSRTARSARDGGANRAFDVVVANGEVTLDPGGIYWTITLPRTVLKAGERAVFKFTIHPVAAEVQPGNIIHMEVAGISLDSFHAHLWTEEVVQPTAALSLPQ